MRTAAVSLVPRPPAPTLGQKVARTFVGFGILAALLVTLRGLSFLLAPIALAFLAFYSLNPVVNWLENRRFSRKAAVGLCFGAGVLALGGVLAAIWPSLESWLQQTPSNANQQSQFELQLAATLNAWQAAGAKAYPHLNWQDLFDHLRNALDSHRRRITETLPQMALDVAGHAGVYALAPVIAFFLLLEGTNMHRKLVSYVPNRYFETTLVLLHRVDRQIASYLRGAAAQAMLISVMMSALLWAVGMPNAVLFGFIFGIINVIPLAGPVIGASAGLLYALMDPTAPSIPVLLACYGGVHAVDVALITPWVVGKSLNLHPLTIIVGLTIGGTLGGILGMLVCIPLIAVAKAIGGTLLEAYEKHELD
jgi:predicted PurR-regulated permease PerM